MRNNNLIIGRNIMMNEDLTVSPISLKSIVENMEKIPEKTGKFGEPSNTLSPKEKKRMLELFGRFNKHGQVLRGDRAIQEAAKELSEMAEMAKKYAMNENNSDFIQKETVSRDFKQVENITKQFQKLAKECVNRQMQLAALYEDLGNLYSRYYSIDEINEMGNSSIPEDVHTNLNTSECSTCGCGEIGNDHGMPTNEEENQLDEFYMGKTKTCPTCGGKGVIPDNQYLPEENQSIRRRKL